MGRESQAGKSQEFCLGDRKTISSKESLQNDRHFALSQTKEGKGTKQKTSGAPLCLILASRPPPVSTCPNPRVLGPLDTLQMIPIPRGTAKCWSSLVVDRRTSSLLPS